MSRAELEREIGLTFCPCTMHRRRPTHVRHAYPIVHTHIMLMPRDGHKGLPDAWFQRHRSRKVHSTRATDAGMLMSLFAGSPAVLEWRCRFRLLVLVFIVAMCLLGSQRSPVQRRGFPFFHTLTNVQVCNRVSSNSWTNIMMTFIHR